MIKKADILFLICLVTAVCIIYAPLFYTEYLYTDEGYQLWLSKSSPVLQTFETQGRYLTYILFGKLFGSADKIRDITHIRLFSFFGWVICSPIWYFILKDVMVKNGLQITLTLLSMVYIFSMPAFTIFVSWGSVSELFIACTAGLISGYLLYKGIHPRDNHSMPVWSLYLLSLAFGILSLFTYQNGFGCFFIPFFIQFVAGKTITRTVIAGFLFSFFIFTIYFLLFKLNLRMEGMGASERSSLTDDPLGKLTFLFKKPLSSAFHFTWLSAEGSIPGKIAYLLVLSTWVCLTWIRQKQKNFIQKIGYFLVLYVFFVFIYLPSLMVKEDYASNRTLFALCLCVFILVNDTLLSLIKQRHQLIFAGSTGILLLVHSWYNFEQGFISPVKHEFDMISKYVSDQVGPGIDTIYFIRPAEDAFVRKYHITASWDEFGVPSTSKPWVPDPLIRQLIYEKTGDREKAARLFIQTWPDITSFVESGKALSRANILINVEELLSVQ